MIHCTFARNGINATLVVTDDNKFSVHGAENRTIWGKDTQEAITLLKDTLRSLDSKASKAK